MGMPPEAVPLPFGPAEFLGQPAEACRFPARTVLLDYMDGEGAETIRAVTVDEVIRYRRRLYLSAYCHERFDRRHFRIDRIVGMRRLGDGEPVDPMEEAARWMGRT